MHDVRFILSKTDCAKRDLHNALIASKNKRRNILARLF